MNATATEPERGQAEGGSEMVTTTSGNLVAGKALAGQGGNGKGSMGRARPDASRGCGPVW